MQDLNLLLEFRADAGSEREADALQSARARLMNDIAAELAVPGAIRSRRRFRVVVPAGATIAAAVAAAMVVTGMGAGKAVDAQAAKALTRVSQVAAASKDLGPIGRGEFFYQKSVEGPRHAVREIWISPDGWNVLRQQGKPETVGGSGPKELRSANGTHRFLTWAKGEHDTFRQVIAPWADGGLTYRELLALPTDPAVLEDRIRREANSAGRSNVELFEILSGVLREAPAPAEVRAALYEVVARIPGVGLVPTIRDGLGRTGVGVYMDVEGERRTLIFDPDTAAILGEQSSSLASGDQLRWSATVRSAITTTVPQADEG